MNLRLRCLGYNQSGIYHSFMMSSIVSGLSNLASAAISTSTSMRLVATSKSSHLLDVLTSATAKVQTETVREDLISLSRNIRGAKASLSIILAENVLATATESSAKAMATQAIVNATSNLGGLRMGRKCLLYTQLESPC